MKRQQHSKGIQKDPNFKQKDKTGSLNFSPNKIVSPHFQRKNNLSPKCFSQKRTLFSRSAQKFTFEHKATNPEYGILQNQNQQHFIKNKQNQFQPSGKKQPQVSLSKINMNIKHIFEKILRIDKRMTEYQARNKLLEIEKAPQNDGGLMEQIKQQFSHTLKLKLNQHTKSVSSIIQQQLLKLRDQVSSYDKNLKHSTAASKYTEYGISSRIKCQIPTNTTTKTTTIKDINVLQQETAKIMRSPFQLITVTEQQKQQPVSKLLYTKMKAQMLQIQVHLQNQIGKLMKQLGSSLTEAVSVNPLSKLARSVFKYKHQPIKINMFASLSSQPQHQPSITASVATTPKSSKKTLQVRKRTNAKDQYQFHTPQTKRLGSPSTNQVQCQCRQNQSKYTPLPSTSTKANQQQQSSHSHKCPVHSDLNNSSSLQSTAEQTATTIMIQSEEMHYYIDKQGYLLDSKGYYLLNQNQHTIKIDKQLLKKLKAKKVIQ